MGQENCSQGDGKIPFLDFKNLSFFFGKRVRVRNGLAFEGLEIGYSGFFENALGSIRPARAGVGQPEKSADLYV